MERLATIPAIVLQHVEDAAFLWSKRRREIDGTMLGEVDIGRLDQRLDANLEGIFASGKAAWDLAISRFADYQEPPELFVISAIALHEDSAKAIGSMLEACAFIGDGGIEAVSGGIARTPADRLRQHVASWLDSREPILRQLGLSALWHNRTNPGPRLNTLIEDADVGVRRASMRLAAALKRRDVLPVVLAALRGNAEDERLTAACAACLLGDPAASYPTLDRLVRADVTTAGAAIEMRLLATPASQAKRWLQERLEQPSLRVAAVAAIGIVGGQSILPWLIEKMRNPALAHAAGLALRDLFEVDFNDTDLFVTDPGLLGEEFATVEDWPLPVADRVTAWWDEGRGPKGHEKFRSMRRQRLDAFRAALSTPDIVLANWRRTRQYPAWM
jgi:uncharacterized protein (TIGR02270 family)